MIRSRVIGTGAYVPPRILSNHDLEKMVKTSDEWIATRTGIKERHIADEESATDIAVKAAKKAVESASLSADEIDLIIVATVTSDMVFPSTACFVQSRLGIKKNIPAFDISAACSGFLYGLDIADKYIKNGAAKKVLVAGVDVFSRIIDWNDRNTCVLFGDGAGAVVLSAERGNRGLLSSHLHSNGDHWRLLYTPSNIYSSPFKTHSRVHSHKHDEPYLKMEGNKVFKLAVQAMGETCQEALEHNDLKPADVTFLIPHQANIRIINATAEKTGISAEKVYINVDRYGNTSAGSIPIALDELAHSGRLKSGDILLMAAFGGGLTWASAVVRW
ncbi:MAG: 3-oxoacyl-ACP synthase [Deltaproteobacteria bacterium GWC2_42_11]|nr:MAG: 3-oxoacyl-ACP synthase [Deltaproteobacteria bacterium GWC2_42_11]HBO83468.1 3-oxoacyl-ACP synthase [Deltaproteobacteria bacterium]